MFHIQWYEVIYQHKTNISKEIRCEYSIKYQTLCKQDTLRVLYSIIDDDLNELTDYYLVNIKMIG